MFISDEEIEGRLKSPSNLINKLEIHKIQRGRGDAVETPIEIKKVVAILGNEGTGQKELAKSFGIAQPTISNFENGRTSYQPKEELQEVIDKVKGRKKEAEDLAIDTLMNAVGLLTPDRLSGVSKAKDIASIAKDMAVVASKMGSSEGEGKKNVHLHLYSPNVKEVSDYEIIDV